MTINRFALEEMQSICYGPIVGIALVNVRVASREVSSYETEVGVVVIQPDPYGPFIS